MVLAGGGEFAFVIFSIARNHGLFDKELHDLLVLTITLSMALTPLVVVLLSRLSGSVRQPAVQSHEAPYIDHEPRVIIMGMGRVGQVVARLLHAQRVPFVGFDTAVEAVEFHRKVSDLPIYYGNPLRLDILHAAKAEHAQFFVIATDDGQANIQTARLVRQRYPHMKVITRALDWEQLHTLLDLDAGPVRETFFSSLEMGRQVLLGLGLSEQQAGARIERFRRHDEQMLQELHKVVSDEAASLRTTHAYFDDLESLFARDVLEEPVTPPEILRSALGILE